MKKPLLFKPGITMGSPRLAFCGLLFVLITLVHASSGHGQASRTWISGVGDDANPCSRTAPCKTFAGAISMTVMNGEIDAIDPGSYGYGTVTITKSITLDGRALFASGSTASLSGININITDKTDAAKSVRIRGLSLNGIGKGNDGINVITANKVTVEDSMIGGFVNNGINVRAGVVFVRNTTILNNGGAGINVETGGQVAITDVTLSFNGTGLAGASGSITSFAGVVLYGNKSGDPK